MTKIDSRIRVDLVWLAGITASVALLSVYLWISHLPGFRFSHRFDYVALAAAVCVLSGFVVWPPMPTRRRVILVLVVVPIASLLFAIYELVFVASVFGDSL